MEGGVGISGTTPCVLLVTSDQSGTTQKALVTPQQWVTPAIQCFPAAAQAATQVVDSCTEALTEQGIIEVTNAIAAEQLGRPVNSATYQRLQATAFGAVAQLSKLQQSANLKQLLQQQQITSGALGGSRGARGGSRAGSRQGNGSSRGGGGGSRGGGKGGRRAGQALSQPAEEERAHGSQPANKRARHGSAGRSAAQQDAQANQPPARTFAAATQPCAPRGVRKQPAGDNPAPPQRRQQQREVAAEQQQGMHAQDDAAAAAAAAAAVAQQVLAEQQQGMQEQDDAAAAAAVADAAAAAAAGDSLDGADADDDSEEEEEEEDDDEQQEAAGDRELGQGKAQPPKGLCWNPDCKEPRQRNNEPNCSKCKRSHKELQEQWYEEHYRKRGVWKCRRRPLELLQHAAMQAHVRSGAENPCHVLVFAWRENLARNRIQTYAYGAVATTMLSKNICKVAQQAYKFCMKRKAAGGAAQGGGEEVAELLCELGLAQHLQALLQQVQTVQELANMTESDIAPVAQLTGIRYLVLKQIVEAAKEVAAADEGGEEEEDAGDEEGATGAADA